MVIFNQRKEYAYTGRRLGSETNLMYFRARYFNTDQGRFINRDPIGYIDGMNLYRGYFVKTGVDPFGLFVEEKTHINCLGYACKRDNAVYPENEESLMEVLNKLGYNCKKDISAKDCKEHCKCVDYIMVYVYIPKVFDFEETKKKYKGKDFGKDKWGDFRGTLDYHAISGQGDGSYNYQSHRAIKDGADDLRKNPKNFMPTDKQPDYLSDQNQMLAKYCCCKK